MTVMIAKLHDNMISFERKSVIKYGMRSIVHHHDTGSRRINTGKTRQPHIKEVFIPNYYVRHFPTCIDNFRSLRIRPAMNEFGIASLYAYYIMKIQSLASSV